MRTWVNGELLADPQAAVLPVTDHGFTVGDGVFEAIKVIDGEPFALTRHLQRLARSAEGLGLPSPDLDAARAGIAAVLAGQDLPLGRIRMTFTAGPSPLGSGRGSGDPTLVVVGVPMDPYPASTSIVTVPWPRNERGALAGLKTTSYAENVVALAHAAERDATEAIFGNTRGHLCEGTGSNIFYVIAGELRTPTLASGCLAGISRALVLEWVGAREVDEPIEVLSAAEEIFLVSTTRDVQAVHTCDGRSLPDPGEQTRKACEIWARREAERIDP